MVIRALLRLPFNSHTLLGPIIEQNNIRTQLYIAMRNFCFLYYASRFSNGIAKQYINYAMFDFKSDTHIILFAMLIK